MKQNNATNNTGNSNKTIRLFREILPNLMRELEKQARKTNDVIVLHHIDRTMKKRDPERYAQFRVDDVTPMLRRAHISLHNKGRKHSKAHNRKIAESIKKTCKDMKFKGRTLRLENKAGYVMYATSCAEAARLVGCSRQLVSQVLSDNPRYHSYTTAHGWTVTII